MKAWLFSILVVAALILCPAITAENVTVPVTDVPTTVPTNVPSPEVTIPATLVTTAPTDVATVVPTNTPTTTPTTTLSLLPATVEMTSGIPVTTIALPPHEQDSGQGIPGDTGIPGSDLTGGQDTAAPASDKGHHFNATCKPPDYLYNDEYCTQGSIRCKAVFHPHKEEYIATFATPVNKVCKPVEDYDSIFICNSKLNYWIDFFTKEVVTSNEYVPAEKCPPEEWET